MQVIQYHCNTCTKVGNKMKYNYTESVFEFVSTVWIEYVATCSTDTYMYS